MSLQQRPIATSFDGVDFHHPEAFWFGAVATTVGVLLHLPMYIGARRMGYHLVGMSVDTPMLVGMFLIIVGAYQRFLRAVPLLGRRERACSGADPRACAR
jgi:MFS transporter, putative metabolite:H+ symporter